MRLAILALTAAVAAAGQSRAQTVNATGNETVDEVVVTARDQAGLLERLPSDTLLGFSKPLIETPRSASFVSAQTLARYGVRSVDALSAVSPGAYTSSFFGVPGSLTVRGTLAENYFRGFKRIENRGTYANPIADAARIDIVRGPPTPIFGSGKVGGQLNFTPISARDRGRLVERTQGDLSASLGAYGHYGVSGQVGAPVSLGDIQGGVRAYAQIERGSEYYRGIRPRRATLQLSADTDLNGAWTLAAGLMAYRSRGDVQNPGWNRLTQDLIENQTYITGRDLSVRDLDGNGKLTPNEISPAKPYPYIDPLFIAYFGGPSAGSDAAHTLDTGVGTTTLDRRTVHISARDFSNTITRTAYVDLVRDAGGGVLKLQLFYDDLNNRRFISYGFPAWYDTQVAEARASYSDRFDLGRVSVDAVGGVSHRRFEGRRRESYNSGLIAYDRRDLSVGAMANDTIDSPFDEDAGITGVGWENDIRSRWNQTGLFLTADISLPLRFNAVIGGRLDRYEVRSTDSGVLAYAPPAASDSDSEATWAASLSWNEGGMVMPYVALAKTAALELGQAGDLSTGIIDSQSWLSEGNLSEAGLKMQLLRGALTGSLAAYRQGRTQLLSGPPPSVQGTRSKGVELELRWLASRRWSFTFSGAMQRTTIKGPDTAFSYIPAYVANVPPAQAFGGGYVVYAFNSLPGRGGDYDYALIPHGVASLYASYSQPLSFGRAGVTAGVSHAGRTAGTVQDAVHYPAYSVVNLSGFIEGDAWTALINVDNLFDTLYFTPDADVYANLGAVPGRGREWRFSLKRSF
jgi:iron complex outermembrane receptor protein